MRKTNLVLSYTPMLMYEGLSKDEAEKIFSVFANDLEQEVDISIDPEVIVYKKDGKELGLIEKDTYLVWVELPGTTDLDTTVQKAAQSISERFGRLEKIKQRIKDETGIGL